MKNKVIYPELNLLKCEDNMINSFVFTVRLVK